MTQCSDFELAFVVYQVERKKATFRAGEKLMYVSNRFQEEAARADLECSDPKPRCRRPIEQYNKPTPTPTMRHQAQATTWLARANPDEQVIYFFVFHAKF